ncbi:MAG: hypothetical protein HQL67_12425 [Magnetococcales bacterium]|nr:hypothetical protein [Magnetococcales bacterium]
MLDFNRDAPQRNQVSREKIPESTVRAIRGRIDLLEFVGRDVKLKKNGVNYEGCCPFHYEKTASFKIKSGEQYFKCFGCGVGGDVVEYIIKSRGVDFVEAVQILAPMAGIDLDNPRAPLPPILAPLPPKESKPDWEPISPVPVDAPEPDFAHSRFGAPSMVWPYHNAQGCLLGFARRFEKPGGGKDIIPLTYCRHPEKGQEWRAKQFQAPRPIYGLDRLAEQPEAPVIIVEGEKACDAAQTLLQGYVCISWPGGGKAVHLADWSVLSGRHVIIIPDADDQGMKTATAIMEVLS